LPGTLPGIIPKKGAPLETETGRFESVLCKGRKLHRLTSKMRFFPVRCNTMNVALQDKHLFP